MTTTITINYSAPLTPNQEVQLNNVAWLYAQFSLTFDGEELAGDTPLDSYFKTHEDHFRLYENVQKFFSDNYLRENVFPSIDFDLTTELEQRILFYQSKIVEKNDSPMTFKEFHTIFKLMLDQFILNLDYNTHNRLWINQPLTEILSNDALPHNFCSVRSQSNPDKIIEDLQKFEINEMFPPLNNKEFKNLLNSDKRAFKFFEKDWQGSKDPKPKSWTYHHAIPSETLIEFYRNYHELLLSKSRRMKEGQEANGKHNFDWVKIMEFNTQKALLLQASKLWSYKPGATVPVMEGRQKDFIRAYYRWLPGLVFLGPESSTRYDDPAGNLRLYFYGQNQNQFESRARCILGNGIYFDNVEQLNNEIVIFNRAYKNGQLKDPNKEAMRLRTRLLTIHKEYNNGKPIWIIPYNPDFWLKPSTIPMPPSKVKLSKSQIWGINIDFHNAVIYDMETAQWINMNDNSDDGPSIEMWKIKMEWREKAIAQAEDNRQQMLQMNLDLPTPNFDLFPNPAFGIVSLGTIGAQEVLNEASIHDELKRKKRHHTSDPTTYISKLRDKCKSHTTTGPVVKVIDFNNPKTDSCGYYLNTGTPSILAVPYWALCKFFG